MAASIIGSRCRAAFMTVASWPTDVRAPHGGRKADLARGRRRAINLHRQKGDAIATYVSCGNANWPPSSMEGVDKVAAVEATDEMIA